MVKSSPPQTVSPKRPDFSGKNIAEMAAILQNAGAQTKKTKDLPPVEQWAPDFCGDIDMEIRADGSWIHEGSPITRKEMVKLFASILRKDADGKTYLVTPVEKVGIRVEDAHFIAVEMSVSPDQLLRFRTHLDDYVEADAHHPLRFEIDAVTGGVKPYINVRGRLEARLTRALTYDLLALGEEADVDGEAMFVIRSKGQVFAVMAMRDLERLSAEL
ncbi:DUF1285 domain-containing protein [Paenochrobactrum pullorum]|uniref:DUF1285 domain-containing protein n=1 Tax=Paenochrobactrum pullorum TaxID=1324351 RepID=UPI0035BC57DE